MVSEAVKDGFRTKRGHFGGKKSRPLSSTIIVYCCTWSAVCWKVLSHNGTSVAYAYTLGSHTAESIVPACSTCSLWGVLLSSQCLLTEERVGRGAEWRLWTESRPYTMKVQ